MGFVCWVGVLASSSDIHGVVFQNEGTLNIDPCTQGITRIIGNRKKEPLSLGNPHVV